jgi:putative SOS response-associated peptidase YedK
MCGRFTLRVPITLLVSQFQIEIGTDQQLPLRFNVAPTQDIPIVRQTDASRELATVRWGLIPSWSKDPKSGPLLINARSETPRRSYGCKSRQRSLQSTVFAAICGYVAGVAIGGDFLLADVIRRRY